VIIANVFEPVRSGRCRPAPVSSKDELRHFEVCPMCDQAVDRRDIYAVMHHLPVGHQPIPTN